MRRYLATALLAIAFASITPAVVHAETPAPSTANTPKLALHKVELWLAMAEPRPSTADLDAGLGVALGAEDRMAMLNTEMAAVATRRRTLQLQEVAARQKIAALQAERDAPRGENGIRRGGTAQKILELAAKADSLHTQTETLFGYMQRIGNEEKGLVDAIGRVRGLADQIETSSIADAKQKQKAVVLASKTLKTFKLHAAMIVMLTTATQATE